MIKEVTRWQAEDGSIHTTEDDAKIYDARQVVIIWTPDQLSPKTLLDDLSFMEGKIELARAVQAYAEACINRHVRLFADSEAPRTVS